MVIIDPRRPTSKLFGSTSAVALCSAYIDTVSVFFRRLPNGIRRSIEAVQGRPLRTKRCEGQDGYVYGWLVTVHQPTIDTLRELEWWRRTHDAAISHVAIAFDLKPSIPMTIFELRAWALQHVALKWSKCGPMMDNEWTTYWREHTGKRPRRNIAGYIAFSKLDGEECFHLELRFQNARACSTAGIETMTDIIDLNPSELFGKHVRLVDYDPEPLMRTAIRKTIAQDVETERTTNRPDHSFRDRYRASLAKRITSSWQRSQRDRVQVFKGMFPDHYARLGSLPEGTLGLPEALTWEARRVGHWKHTVISGESKNGDPIVQRHQ